ncbi:hypothetical protein MN202_14530 [Rheinheimera muenzenbergensis]|uniref:Type II secretion system protein N n=1 Tax=Rheinheimera muenzenbergensis TaxID=1193628 RepID=A0ABU8CA12_9GAMM
MKSIIFGSALLLGSFGSLAEGYQGQWRGVLQLTPESGIVLGVKLTPAGQGYQLVLFSPNQHDQPIEPSSVSIAGDVLTFSVDALSARFEGRFNGDSLTGIFTQGRERPVTLTRLGQADLASLQNEQQWAGDLVLSKNASLPLVLNVAVIAGGYHVTLDSPKQQSFGIPVDEFSVSAQQLSFSSSRINASYQGQWHQDQWQGTFVQGQAVPLNLKKKL